MGVYAASNVLLKFPRLFTWLSYYNYWIIIKVIILSDYRDYSINLINAMNVIE